MYDHFYHQIQILHGEDKVKNGQFAAMMDVALVNDGPVSLSYSPCTSVQSNTLVTRLAMSRLLTRMTGYYTN